MTSASDCGNPLCPSCNPKRPEKLVQQPRKVTDPAPQDRRPPTLLVSGMRLLEERMRREMAEFEKALKSAEAVLRKPRRTAHTLDDLAEQVEPGPEPKRPPASDQADATEMVIKGWTPLGRLSFSGGQAFIAPADTPPPAVEPEPSVPQTAHEQVARLMPHYADSLLELGIAPLGKRGRYLAGGAVSRLVEYFDDYGHSGLFSMEDDELALNADQELEDWLNYRCEQKARAAAPERRPLSVGDRVRTIDATPEIDAQTFTVDELLPGGRFRATALPPDGSILHPFRIDYALDAEGRTWERVG